MSRLRQGSGEKVTGEYEAVVSNGDDKVPPVICKATAGQAKFSPSIPIKPAIQKCGISPRAPLFRIRRYVLFVSASASRLSKSARP